MVIDALGVQSLTIPITAMVDPLLARYPEASSVRRGNVMARMRMIVLYDQSEAFHGLVVGTGNKTEILLGYTTLYGDSACAINPLGDLYKTQLPNSHVQWAYRLPSSKKHLLQIYGKGRQMKVSWVIPMRRSTNCFTCWLTSVIDQKSASRLALPRTSSEKLSNACGVTNSSAFCLRLPNSPIVPWATIFYI